MRNLNIGLFFTLLQIFSNHQTTFTLAEKITPSNITLIRTPGDGQLRTGEGDKNHTISCEARTNYETPHIRWEHDGKQFENTNWITTDETKGHRTSTIIWPKMTKKMKGVYTCIAQIMQDNASIDFTVFVTSSGHWLGHMGPQYGLMVASASFLFFSRSTLMRNDH